jgi:hypothetical protein
MEDSNDRIAASNVHHIINKMETLNGFFRAYEAFGDRISLDINTSDHLIPGSSEKHHVFLRDARDRNRISKFENSCTKTRVMTPLSNRAIIGRSNDEFSLSV